MKASILVIVIHCFVNCIAASAQQKDYVITKGGDTLKCEVKGGSFWSGALKYRMATMTDYQLIDSTVFKEYYREKDGYPHRLMTLPGAKLPDFVSVLEDGEIKVYEAFDHVFNSPVMPVAGLALGSGGITPGLGIGLPMGNSSKRKRWFAIKAGQDSLVEIKSNDIFLSGKTQEKRLQAIQNLIADKNGILMYFNKKKYFKFDDLLDIIHYYNTGKHFTKHKENVYDY